MGKWDRKLVGFFTLAASFVTIGVVGVMGVAAKSASRPAPDTARAELRRALAQLQEITHEYFDHPQAAAAEAFIAQQHERVRDLASSQPEAIRVAQVIFRRDLGSSQVEQLARQFGLAVHEAELVILTRDGGEYESPVPLQFFLQRAERPGPVIDVFANHLRRSLLAQAGRVRKEGHPRGEEMASYLESLSQGSARVLRVGVAAKVGLLRLLSGDPAVYALVMDPAPERVALLDDMRHRLAQNTAIQDVTDPSAPAASK
jgi:hypothetical protein